MLDDASVLDVDLVVVDHAGINICVGDGQSVTYFYGDRFKVNDEMLTWTKDRFGTSFLWWSDDEDLQQLHWGRQRLAIASDENTWVQPEVEQPTRYQVFSRTILRTEDTPAGSGMHISSSVQTPVVQRDRYRIVSTEPQPISRASWAGNGLEVGMRGTE